MDPYQTSQQTDALPDTTSLLPSLSSVTSTLAPYLLLSTVISILLLVAYIFSVIRRYKVEKAILAMQKDIREMNERERDRATPLRPATESTEDTPLIAAEPPVESVG